mgnify:CR=1 FL=1
MSLKEQDRVSLVILGLEKSDKMLAEAERLVEVVGVLLQTDSTKHCFMQSGLC